MCEAGSQKGLLNNDSRHTTWNGKFWLSWVKVQVHHLSKHRQASIDQEPDKGWFSHALSTTHHSAYCIFNTHKYIIRKATRTSYTNKLYICACMRAHTHINARHTYLPSNELGYVEHIFSLFLKRSPPPLWISCTSSISHVENKFLRTEIFPLVPKHDITILTEEITLCFINYVPWAM